MLNVTCCIYHIVYIKESYCPARMDEDIFNLQRSCRMFVFENLTIMYSSTLMTCFVQYSAVTVYHVLCLYSMFLLTRVIVFSHSLVLWSWYFLFSGVYESLETRKVLFNSSSKLSSTGVG
jgi:hypothetical protein